MKIMRNIEIEAVTLLFTGGGKFFASLSDKSMIKLLRSLRSIVSDKDMKENLEELIDAVKDGPPNTDTLRRMLSESRYDEIKEFVESTIFFRELDPEDF